MAKKKKKTTKTKTKKTLDPGLPVFQLTITLEDIEPAVWRRVETPDCSLADLHEIIQSCLGWDDEHMYAFEIGEEQYTDLERGADPDEYEDSAAVRLSDIIKQGRHCFEYEYDFGDSWRHAIEIENTLPPAEHARYPRCVDGRRGCPPEDCGGPYGYEELLEAWANRNTGEEREYDERLEWLAHDFDPETFSLDKVNEELLRIRRWIGQEPGSSAQAARFAVGDRVRTKPGVMHGQYPDIPLGGWVGTITKIAWLVPLSYEVRWTDETLAAAHPVYGKRCRRDDDAPETYWLDEGDLDADCPERPVEMEQPANLIVKPLSAEDQDDRIRMVFGLTSDDRLPTTGDETQQQYLDYLKAHLTFPFNATYWSLTPDAQAEKHGVVVGFASPSPIDTVRGPMCEVRREDKTEPVALDSLEPDEGDPNCRYVDDYKYWLEDVQDIGRYIEEDDEGYGGDEDEEYSDHEDEGSDAGEDYPYEQEGFGPRLAGDPNDEDPPLEPIRRAQPPTGRNEPCPCGSGKKFKKCCLGKRDDGVAE